LLKDLKEKFNLTYLFISHDLSTVKSFCSRTAVMYLGEIVEIAKTEELFSSPKHPYTKALLNSVLQVDKGSKTKVELIKGELPSNENLPVGCNFASRCPYATQECLKKEPETTEISQTHKVNCFNFQ
jgi:oligopeptide/dipeptide ABC transporter ATP-binding protein